MNTKNNRRRRESVERIESTFMELIQTKELNEITVSEICKRCELNRSTFYANFIDIYDLADKIQAHLEEEVARLYEPERTQMFDSHDYLKLFRHIKDNQIFYRTFFKLGYDAKFKLGTYNIHLAESHFNNNDIEYHVEFFRSGFNAIVKMWLDRGCKESPEQMDRIIRSEYQGRT
ncbi:MAG: TetR/AcrR family transcriptional regulator [Acutalibacteraceae bacterium]